MARRPHAAARWQPVSGADFAVSEPRPAPRPDPDLLRAAIRRRPVSAHGHGSDLEPVSSHAHLERPGRGTARPLTAAVPPAAAARAPAGPGGLPGPDRLARPVDPPAGPQPLRPRLAAPALEYAFCLSPAASSAGTRPSCEQPFPALRPGTGAWVRGGGGVGALASGSRGRVGRGKGCSEGADALIRL